MKMYYTFLSTQQCTWNKLSITQGGGEMEYEIQLNIHKILKCVSLRLSDVDNFHKFLLFKGITYFFELCAWNWGRRIKFILHRWIRYSLLAKYNLLLYNVGSVKS